MSQREGERGRGRWEGGDRERGEREGEREKERIMFQMEES